MRLRSSLPADCAFLSASGIRIRPPFSGRPDGMGLSFKAVLAHSATFDGPWALSVSVCSKRQNYRAACAANAQNGCVVNPNSLVSVLSGAGFMFFCLRHIESVACKRLQSTLRASERFRFAGIMRFLRLPDTQIRGKQNSARQIP